MNVTKFLQYTYIVEAFQAHEINEAEKFISASPKFISKKLYEESQFILNIDKELMFFTEKKKLSKKEKEKKKKLEKEKLNKIKKDIKANVVTQAPSGISSQAKSLAVAFFRNLVRSSTIERVISFLRKILLIYTKGLASIVKTISLRLGLSAGVSSFLFAAINTILSIALSLVLTVAGGILFSILWSLLMRLIRGLFNLIKRFIGWLKGKKKEDASEVKKRVKTLVKAALPVTKMMASKVPNSKKKQAALKKLKQLEIKTR